MSPTASAPTSSTKASVSSKNKGDADAAPIIVWFRNDLRLTDNPALYFAAKQKAPLVFVYIQDDTDQQWAIGGASQWWLHHSLTALQAALNKTFQATLLFQQGSPLTLLSTLIELTQAQAIYYNRCYEPHAISRDTTLKTHLQQQGIEVKSFNGTLLHEPWEYSPSSRPRGQHDSPHFYQVFTPFWRFLQKLPVRDGYPIPKSLTVYPIHAKISALLSSDVNSLKLLPTIPWHTKLPQHWQAGEKAAKTRLQHFLRNALQGYETQRNFPHLANTSCLSPHLHFGEISPVQIWHATQWQSHHHPACTQDAICFLKEIAWREFSYHLLYFAPDLPNQAFKKSFQHFPWAKRPRYLTAWKKGLTGYPFVDAGMRQLWETGWMHNRVRMITASFLIKNLLQPWQQGEAWFWDTLVDADLANNAASWQWVAGSGADAAPYFRIFNPILQSEKFDPDGEYIKTWIPELRQLPKQYIHEPWKAPQAILVAANITMGKTYPLPIVDHQVTRTAALDAYKKMKQ